MWGQGALLSLMPVPANNAGETGVDAVSTTPSIFGGVGFDDDVRANLLYFSYKSYLI